MAHLTCQIIPLPSVHDPRGDLVFMEFPEHIPFIVKRIFYIHSVPHEAKRGGHAHYQLQQLIIPLRGDFSLVVRNKNESFDFSIPNHNQGIYIPPMHWVDITKFSSDALFLVLCSDKYDENDYIRNLDDFLKITSNH